MPRRTTLAALAVCLVASAVFAQEKVTFQAKYTPGTYLMTMKMNSEQQITGMQEMTQNLSMIMTMEMTVDKPTDAGQVMHMTYRRIQQNLKGGPMEMAFDSAQEPKEGDPMAMLRGMIDKPIDITIDAKGKIVKTEGMDKIFEAMVGDNPQMKQMLPKLKEQFGENNFKEMFGQQMFQYPDKPVAVGDSWDMSLKQNIPMIGGLTLKQTNTLKKVEQVGDRKLAVIAFEGKMERDAKATSKATTEGEEEGAAAMTPKFDKFDLKQSGTVKVDTATGMMEEGDIAQDSDMAMNINAGEQQMKMSVKGKTKINITVKPGKYVAPPKTATKPTAKSEATGAGDF